MTFPPVRVGGVHRGQRHESGSSFILTSGDDIEFSDASDEDYDFTASARQDVPRLIEEVRLLRERLAVTGA